MPLTSLSMRTLTSTLLGAVLLLALVTASPAQAAVPDPANDPAYVPLSQLRPSVATASGDRPPLYADGCHVSAESTAPTSCIYGDPNGTRVVVAIGDSTIAQWWSALDGAARAQRWRLVWMTKSACPAQDVTLRLNGSPYTACDTWRRNVLAKIRNMPRVDIVVMGGAARSTLMRRGTSTVITDPAERDEEWRRGTLRTFTALKGEVRRAIVFRATPAFTVNVPQCLRQYNGWTRWCSRDRKSAVVDGAWAAERAAANAYTWARATQFTDDICRPDRCWPVTSTKVLRYRDKHHMTATFVRALTPTVRYRLAWHLAN